MRLRLGMVHRLWITAATFVAVAACSPADGEEATTSGAADQDAAGARVINVEVTPVELTDFVQYVRITGEVEALHDVTVAAEESGAITHIYVQKGTRVQKGAALMKIDDALLVASVDEARALSELADEQNDVVFGRKVPLLACVGALFSRLKGRRASCKKRIVDRMR